MKSPFGKFRNEGGGREFFLSPHREREEGHRGCSHRSPVAECLRLLSRGAAPSQCRQVSPRLHREKDRGQSCSGPPIPMPARRPEKLSSIAAPAHGRACDGAPLPPVLGARMLRSQHSPSSHRTTSVGCSPHHCCSIFSPLPGPVAPSDAAHKGEASQGCLGERAAFWGVSCRCQT